MRAHIDAQGAASAARLPMTEALSMNAELEVGVLQPPADVLDGNGWGAVRSTDPLLHYLMQRFAGRTSDWQVTRLLGAAYAYRNRASNLQLVAKFYSAKTEIKPELQAEREYQAMERVRPILGECVLTAFAAWRGVLMLPFVRGLTLESSIAVRRNQPGQLGEQLEMIALLLARLHAATAEPHAPHDASIALAQGHRFVASLAQFGVLESDPLLVRTLELLLSRWAERSVMRDFVPAFVHGDVTTGNFIFSSSDQIVALDWERAVMADPALDLGRLAAEVTHSVTQNGGTVAEAMPLVERLTDTYCAALPSALCGAALTTRAVYYRAVTNLRIARNGWAPRRQRMALVAQALALLASA